MPKTNPRKKYCFSRNPMIVRFLGISDTIVTYQTEQKEFKEI